MVYSFKISEHDGGRRLDKVLRKIWPDLPLGGLMRALRKGQVRLDGKKVSCSTRVEQGQLVQVPFEPPQKPSLPKAVPVEGELDTVFGDANVLVLNKPPGLLSQPAGSGDDSLISRVWALTGTAAAGFRPSAVHRLDRNTSGLVVVALTGQALRLLHQVFRERNVSKVYWAIVKGEVPVEGEIDAPILKDRRTNKVQISSEGRSSQTRYRCIESDRGLSLVELELLTGRPHQARVHMAHAGHPILGDPKYGEGGFNSSWSDCGAWRPMLHARSLRFGDLPEPLEALSDKVFTAPLPGDFRQILKIWE